VSAFCRVLLSMICLVSPAAVHAGVVLITPTEASLPPPAAIQAVVPALPPATPASSRAITRGPRIEISDLEEGKLRSPLHFKLKFRAFNGAKVDPASLTVTYLRIQNVDLTSRIKPYVDIGGIDIPDAEVPPGEHGIRIDLKDTEGRQTTTSFSLSVAPK
jgi:hypothetical protein